MSQDRLPEIAGRVRALDDEPVAEHPDALEDVHRALVEELEALAGSRGAGAPDAAGTTGGTETPGGTETTGGTGTTGGPPPSGPEAPDPS